MAINFPDSPSNGDTFTANGKTFVYNSTNTSWRPQTAAESGGTDVLADMAALIAKTGMSNGDQALVQSNNNLYMYSGSGWYKIATIQNDAPSAITGVDGSYALATDGTATTITAVSTDPEGFALTWSYTTSGLGSIATVSQVDNVFTVTPSTDAANVGTFTLTISATDGINGAVSTVPSFTLAFIVTNSRYTALSVKATNTGSNQTFDDASSSNHTITASGDATASTFSPHRHGGYSAYFDGSGDYLTAPDHEDFNVGSENFTAECWIYPTASPSQPIIMGQWSGSYSWALQMSNNSSRHLRFLTNAGGIVDNVSSTVVPLNQWSHVALVRNGNSFVAYLNGTSVVSSTVTSALSNSTNPLSIGSGVGGSQPYQGYISSVRLVKGTAVYTSNFTPPTEPLTAITNTKFLLGRLPYFKDQSASNHAITATGNVSLRQKSVYDNDPYSEASHGASVYLEAGDNDYLSMPAQTIPTGSFTVEGWYYLDGTQSNSVIVSQGSSGNANRLFIGIESVSGTQSLRFQIGSNYVNGPAAVPNIWTHFCATCNGSAMQLFQNGVSAGTTSYSSNVEGVAMFIGRLGTAWSGGYGLKGYVADIRVSSIVRQSSNFTPPAAPLTAITNTKFLLNPTLSISDLSQSSAITCVGDAATDATTVKFAGTKSIAFDGTGDNLLIPNPPTLGSNDFTIEGWMYFSSLNASASIVSRFNTANNNGYEIIYVSSTGKFHFQMHTGSFDNGEPSAASNLSLSTWYHFAAVRQGTNKRLFIDGTQLSGYPISIGSGAITGETTIDLLIGDRPTTPLRPVDGYIQDLRITKGLARYTANFTPPTAELQG